MRRTLMVGALALLVAGCASTPTGTPPISEVQRQARQICGFVPAAQTIAAIFAAGGWIGGALGVAKEICDAVILNPMTEGPTGRRTVPLVRGVEVRGQFVRRR